MDFDGTHLLADLFGCAGLDDIELVRRALSAAVAAAGATLLELKLHGFGIGQGVTGVALLAESHISIHTWPERNYAAVDIFLCGSRHKVRDALTALITALAAERVQEQCIERGFRSQAKDS